MAEETIARWRFDKLRKAMTVALCEASILLRHEEDGNYLDAAEAYHKLVELNKSLADGLHEGTQP